MLIVKLLWFKRKNSATPKSLGKEGPNTDNWVGPFQKSVFFFSCYISSHTTCGTLKKFPNQTDNIKLATWSQEFRLKIKTT